MIRVRRHRTPSAVECPPSRVRRVRPSAGGAEPPKPAIIQPQAVSRVRRTRPNVGPETAVASRPLFLINWDRPLSYKFSIYMVTSYLYYCMNRSMITDHEYDQLCKELDAGYRKFDHPHKHLVDRGQFRAATGYAIKYPSMVIGAAEHMLAHYSER